MTRTAQPETSDLHERFGQWLQAGAPGEPARDVAVHAAHCPRCRTLVDAWDRLALVDTGRAPMPPSRAVAAAPVGRLLAIRAGAALAGGAAVVAVAIWIVASGPGLAGIGQTPGTPTPDQQVLGGIGAGEDTPSPTGSPEAPASATQTATPSPRASSEAVSPSESPASAPTPPPVATQRPPTPPPTPVPTLRPTATPTPTPPPSVEPRVPPSVEPSTPPPSAEPSSPPPSEEPSATPPSQEPSASPS